MTLIDSTTIPCPRCRRPQTVTVYKTANVTLEPDLKARLLDGSLNAFVCDDCGHKGHLEYDILYHDMHACRMIWVFPNAWKPGFDVQKQLGAMPMPELLGTLRLVRDWNALKEKIHIFADGLDDRMLELIKVFLAARFDEDLKRRFGAMLYDRWKTEADGSRHMQFCLIGEDDQAAFSIREAEFKLYQEKLASLLPDQAEEHGKWLRVDRTYAEDIMLRDKQQSEAQSFPLMSDPPSAPAAAQDFNWSPAPTNPPPRRRRWWWPFGN